MKEGMNMRETPIEDEVYEHFKGHRYQILTIAKNIETGENMVVYKGTCEPYQVFAQDLENFLAKVDREKNPESQQENYFEKCDIDVAIHPKLNQFLDAETYEEKLGVLISMESVVTNSMINTMAIVLDVVVLEGEVEERYEALKGSLQTLEKFECNRFR